MSDKLVASGNWAIVDPVKVNDKVDGIFIPKGAEDAISMAEVCRVISVGDEAPASLKKAKKVFVLRGTCFTLPVIDGKSYLGVKMDKIIGVAL